MKHICRKCNKTFEGRRADMKFCSDICRMAIKTIREKHGDIKDDTDKLIAFLEATSVRDLEASGIFIPGWKRNGSTMRGAESKILDVMEKMGGTYTYKGCRVTI